MGRKRGIWIAVACVVAFVGCAGGTGADPLAEQGLDRQSEASPKFDPEHSVAVRWTFDEAEGPGLPAGWKAEGTNQRGEVASWVVRAQAGAPSQPNVLALTDVQEGWGGTFNLCWTDAVTFEDGVIEVKVKAGTGREDQGGGPIWRVQDKDNYYIARWNPLEDNFRLYSVAKSRRKTLASAQVKVDPSLWHTIRIEQSGDEIRAYFDHEALPPVHDTTFTTGGGVGVWSKADAATAFDSLELKVPSGPAGSR